VSHRRRKKSVDGGEDRIASLRSFPVKPGESEDRSCGLSSQFKKR